MEQSHKKFPIYGWFILILAIVSGFLIKYNEEYNILFLILLIAELILAFIFRKKIFDKNVITVSRILLGLLFIFSGFVKAVDPVGTEYRIVDYFIAYDMDWAQPMSLYLSVFLNAFEFVVGGILLLMNVKIRIIAWLVMLMMGFFTITTLYDALYSPVPDCGCFGDALIISNWQTFYKNIVINVLVIIVFFNRNSFKKVFKCRSEWVIIGLALFAGVYFQIYNIRHLPVVDFRPWKVGNKMALEDAKPMKYYLTYMNKETGEKQEYLSPDYPYNDSVWMSQWVFVNQRIEDPNPRLHDLGILDSYGSDVTSPIIENLDFQFILVSYDLSKFKGDLIPGINDFYKQCENLGISFIMLTSDTPEDIEVFKKRVNPPDFEYYFADDISLKTMIRSNPGIVLLKGSIVKAKWHYNDFPDFQGFIEEFYNKCSLPQ